MDTTRIGRALAVGFGMALLASTLAIAPVMAASGSQVQGVLTLDTASACTGDPETIETYVVTGTLKGCWYIETSIQVSGSQNGGEWTGAELFVGCLGSACGTFRTEYYFWATYDASGAETHGHCHHDLVSGTGAFAAGSGFIEMHDNPDGTASPGANYSGHIG
jgi:hypothetical protein